DTIEAYYAAAVALGFPTPSDAFGMGIAEAMACGLAVVTTRSAGAAELVTDGEDGFLLDAAVDHDAIAGRMRQLLEAGIRDRMGVAAHRSMARQTSDAVAEKTLKLYET